MNLQSYVTMAAWYWPWLIWGQSSWAISTHTTGHVKDREAIVLRFEAPQEGHLKTHSHHERPMVFSVPLKRDCTSKEFYNNFIDITLCCQRKSPWFLCYHPPVTIHPHVRTGFFETPSFKEPFIIYYWAGKDGIGLPCSICEVVS